jgi:hypothetical protein
MTIAPGGRPDRSQTKVYLVGGGIASLAAAAFLIRDGHVLGHNITIFEALDRLGGSLDGAGTAEHGYTLRGGRMFEGKYQCTFDLLSSIPTLDKKQTVTQEIRKHAVSAAGWLLCRAGGAQVFVDFDELLETFDAERREGGDGNIVVDVADIKTAVFGFHLEGDLFEPGLVLTEHDSHASDREHVAGSGHDQAAAATGWRGRQCQGNNSSMRLAG